MYVHAASEIKRAYQRRASVIRYLGRSGRRGLGVDVIIVIASGRHVAGGVRRHVAASVLQQVVSAADPTRCRRRRRRRLPHTPYGRVRAVGAGYRPDTYQHVGVGHVRGARVAGAENIREKRVIDGFLRALSGNGVLHTPPSPPRRRCFESGEQDGYNDVLRFRRKFTYVQTRTGSVRRDSWNNSPFRSPRKTLRETFERSLHGRAKHTPCMISTKKFCTSPLFSAKLIYKLREFTTPPFFDFGSSQSITNLRPGRGVVYSVNFLNANPSVTRPLGVTDRHRIFKHCSPVNNDDRSSFEQPCVLEQSASTEHEE